MGRSCFAICRDTTSTLLGCEWPGAALADQDGNFSFAAVVPGRYRLVVDFRGYCAANVPLRVVRWPRGGWHRKLVVHMSVGHIDTCSVGDYK
jgi:hypothetical protein